MITVNKIKEDPCGLYDPQGKFVGIITSILEFYDVRIQIKQNKVSGYYIITVKGDRLDISQNGDVVEWFKEPFCLIDEQLDKLLD